MINIESLQGRDVHFHTGDPDEDKNIFTTIVGKNGSGKSRLLRNVIARQIERHNSPGQLQVTRHCSRIPANIIALSTSPFDRFPMEDIFSQGKSSFLERAEGYYFYQGLRGLYSANLSMSFMVRIFGSLVRALSADKERLITILDVLDYLGYHKHIEARFQTSTTLPTMERLAHAVDPIEAMYLMASGEHSQRIGVDVRKVLMRLQDASYEFKLEFIEALRYLIERNRSNKLEIAISDRGVFNSQDGRPLASNVAILFECGLFRLKDLRLHKKGLDKPFRIIDASSGEQCVVMAMLGIAARISDYSLICIDEPEICLHPEWQERYIQLLMSTFSGFKGCHFIIATHSPQVISKLQDDNCYILDLQSFNVVDAAGFNNRSADFQLAQVFGAPGYKNEYMMRELLAALTALSGGHELSSEKLSVLKRMMALRDSLDQTDPVLQLIELLDVSLGDVDNG